MALVYRSRASSSSPFLKASLPRSFRDMASSEEEEALAPAEEVVVADGNGDMAKDDCAKRSPDVKPPKCERRTRFQRV